MASHSSMNVHHVTSVEARTEETADGETKWLRIVINDANRGRVELTLFADDANPQALLDMLRGVEAVSA